VRLDKNKCKRISNILRVVVVLYLAVLIGYSFIVNSAKVRTPPVQVAVISTPTSVPTAASTDMINKFTDIQGHWAKQYFSLLLQKSVVSGYPDNTLRPEMGISRSEAAVMVVKAADIRLSYSQLLDMEDEEHVKDWAKQFIITAVNNDVIKGYNDRTFRPDNKITRCEMIVMVLNAFGIEQSQVKETTFSDSDLIPEWSKGFVNKAVDMGIVKGYEGDNTFRPGKEIIRAEAVTIIAKCLELKEK
jgi:hypothetical protein